jgi:hypothetical protein
MTLVHPSEIAESIQPVITKCKVDDDELDLDSIKEDIEEIITPLIEDPEKPK